MLILPQPLIPLPNYLDTLIHIPLYLPRNFLNTLLHCPLPLLHQPPDTLKLLPQLLFDAPNELRHLILPLQDLSLHLNMLGLPAAGLLKQGLQVLDESRTCLPQCLDLVTAMAAMDHALGADGRALAGEAVVTDMLIWVLLARNLIGLRRLRRCVVWSKP